MHFTSASRYTFLLVIYINAWLLVCGHFALGMLGGGMMGHNKGGSGSNNMESMLVAGILAKLLSGKQEKENNMAHPVYVPMPMVYHHMSTPTMNVHHMPSYGWSNMGGGNNYGYGGSMSQSMSW